MSFKNETHQSFYTRQFNFLELPLVQHMMVQQNNDSASAGVSYTVQLKNLELGLFALRFNIVRLLRLVAKRFRLVAR